MTNEIETRECRIIEIIGLAGSGKTTTCKILRERYAEVLPIYRVARRRLAGAILRWIRDSAKGPAHRKLRDPGGGWTGLHLSIHMDAMLQDLLSRRRQLQHRLGTLLLDQGPIFNCILAERLASQGEVNESVPKRMRELLIGNLDFLDALVVLDADLPILLQRIDDREQDHRIKGAGENSAQNFLEDYRERYDSLVSEIQDRTDIAVLRLDTGRQNPEEIAGVINSRLALGVLADPGSPGPSTTQ